MNFYDFHMHSLFSSDSKAVPEEMLKSAAAKGLSGICFTEHNDFDYPAEDGSTMFSLDFDKYFKYTDALRSKNTTNLSICIGVEQGLSVPASERINNYDCDKKLDFIIGSSHIVDGFDPYYPEFWKNRSVKDAIASYFEAIYQNIKVCDNFDVYGHLDYIVRYAPDKDHSYNWLDYRDILDSILKMLVQKGKGIEINTSGLKSGLKYPNPCIGIVKMYHNAGGEIITIGSDAHNPEHIAYSFDILPEMLKSAGFKYYTTFRQRKPEFHKL